ncbi:hypothetical protein LTR66_014490 [Elasticomyces elasticus]|nr:hypothetical protein LTR66_014490 [Elasticomyces elasticus]
MGIEDHTILMRCMRSNHYRSTNPPTPLTTKVIVKSPAIFHKDSSIIEVFHMSRQLLLSASDFFSNALTYFSEGYNNEVTLNDTDPFAFRVLALFLHDDTATLDNLLNIYPYVRAYQLADYLCFHDTWLDKIMHYICINIGRISVVQSETLDHCLDIFETAQLGEGSMPEKLLLDQVSTGFSLRNTTASHSEDKLTKEYSSHGG